MMPKAYFYTDAEVGVPWPGPDPDHEAHGFPEPRFNWEEMPGFEATEDPNQADVFVVRQRLSWLTQDHIGMVRHRLWMNGAYRHVFFDLADNFQLYPLDDAMQFRGCADRPMVEAQPNIIPIAWPVEDFGDLTGEPTYDVCFQGQHNALADRAMESCIKAGLSCNFIPTEEFWPHIRNKDPERGKALWDSFRQNILSAKVSLCPRTLDRGVIRYRLYEAMTMRRCSVLIGDDCLLPFPEHIDWPRCVLRVPEDQVDFAGPLIGHWLARREGQLDGEYARGVWRAFLDRNQYGKMISLTVKERLGL